MIIWRRIPDWLLRAWPLIAVAPFFGLHYIALQEYLHSSQLVNKLMGMTLQLTGGLIILYSVNDNLGMFKSRSIWAAVSAWLSEFPISRQATVLGAGGIASSEAHGTATITTYRSATTVEERLEQLERGLVAIRKELATGLASVHEEVSAAKAQLGSHIDSTAKQVADLSHRVERVTVGGFKLQLFGVILAVYGAVTSVFA